MMLTPLRRWLNAVAIVRNQKTRLAACLAVAWVCFAATTPTAAQRHGEPANPLPLPSGYSVLEFERLLFPFLQQRRYAALGWARDKGVRDTGPFINGVSYGTHPAVRVYYSPAVVKWLESDRRSELPDGAMIIKEQFEPPAARYEAQPEAQLIESIRDWTVMIKDSRGSRDGWFWSNPGSKQKPTENKGYPFDYPTSAFGMYCVRCHASTKSDGPVNEYTFASLRNIEGYRGEPVIFRVDDSWRKPKPPRGEDTVVVAEVASHPKCSAGTRLDACEPKWNSEFGRLFAQIGSQDRDAIQKFPGVTYDWVVPRPEPQMFLTSNQCMNCHGGLTGPFGPTMFLSNLDQPQYGDPGVNISPYGEWRWSPMGLAGRDPIFFAQLESEVAILEASVDDPEQRRELVAEVKDTCLSCHGAMGQRQLALDRESGKRVPTHFDVSHVFNTSVAPSDPGHSLFAYGALAREGISCAVCHHMTESEQPESDSRPYLQFFLENSTTGRFELGPVDALYGPYKDKDIAPYAMEHALGAKPKHNAYLQSSRMCGSCHVINLPVLDHPRSADEPTNALVEAAARPKFRGFEQHVEQATYLEWLNSEFENEFQTNNPKGRSCQDCHMPKSYHGPDLSAETLDTRIAVIQDATYPEAENLAPLHDLNVRRRRGDFRRHTFQGLNAFLLEIMRQNDDLLGVRRSDFMTGSKTDLDEAIAHLARNARKDVVDLSAATAWGDDGRLRIDVGVRNKVGHRFPSGVGFRRAFLEVAIIERGENGKDRVVWASGRTNAAGAIVDTAGRVLPTEFFPRQGDSEPAHQRHHQTISSDDQVQIYEHLVTDAKGDVTTSFLHQSHGLKENRLPPRGWSPKGPSPEVFNGPFLEATLPGEHAAKDPDYQNDRGRDNTRYLVALADDVRRDAVRVEVRLNYQAIPPYFLEQIFRRSPQGPATKRLHYICANLDLSGTPLEGWKLVVAETSAVPKAP